MYGYQKRSVWMIWILIVTLLIAGCSDNTPLPDTPVPVTQDDSTTIAELQATLTAVAEEPTEVPTQADETPVPTEEPAPTDTPLSATTAPTQPIDESASPTQPTDKSPVAMTNTPPPIAKNVLLGRATWDTGWFQAELLKQLLEELGYNVDGPKTYDNQEFYLSAASGLVDVWPNGWYPLHSLAIEDERLMGKVEFVGMEVKAGALQGYLIDKATADELSITSLADLKDPDIAAAFDSNDNGKADLIGCDFGWGCEQVIEHHLDAYDLRDTVEHIQGEYASLMTEAIERYQNGQPILFYTWTPNWTVGKLVPGQDVVWLTVPFADLPADQKDKEDSVTVNGVVGCVEDPCMIGFPPNDIRVAANTIFLQKFPDVRRLIELFEIPPMDISAQNSKMFDGENSEEDIQRHAQEWIAQNRNIVDQWLTEAQIVAESTTPVAIPDINIPITTTVAILPLPTMPQESMKSNDAIELRMLYSSDKQPWIEHVTRLFNAGNNTTDNGTPIYVDAIPMGSVESMDKILSGTDEPDIWSPSSSILFPLANKDWGAANNGAKLVQNPFPLVRSPVVIAMWKPMAEAMGWPQQPLGWADIAEFARSGKTWADYEHPEWGAFKFGHTHPEHSSSGLITMLATAYAGAGKTRDLTIADLEQTEVSQLVADVESSIIHYGESTGFFGRQMIEGGPSYLSASVLYENLVLESYDKELYPSRALPIVAIYPKEGTFWSDHPFALMPWTQNDSERRDAAQIYRDFLLDLPQQELALQFGYRPIDQRVQIAGVLGANRGVDPNQPATLIEVPDAEILEAVRELWSENKKRVEVMVLLDTSGSMNTQDPPDNLVRIVEAKNGLKAFINQLQDADRLGLTTFNFAAAEITPLDEIGPKRDMMVQRIDNLFADGGTRLIDTLSEAYETLQNEPPGKYIRAIVVLSDGADTTSMLTQDDLLQLVGADQEGYSIKIYTIAYGSEGDVEINHDLLQAIAKASGGKYYKSDPRTIEEVYLAISRFF